MQVEKIHNGRKKIFLWYRLEPSNFLCIVVMKTCRMFANGLEVSQQAKKQPFASRVVRGLWCCFLSNALSRSPLRLKIYLAIPICRIVFRVQAGEIFGQCFAASWIDELSMYKITWEYPAMISEKIWLFMAKNLKHQNFCCSFLQNRHRSSKEKISKGNEFGVVVSWSQQKTMPMCVYLRSQKE